MSKIINIGPLAFYDSPEKQQHNKPYAFGQMWPLVIELGKLPYFQFTTDLAASNSIGPLLNYVHLVRVDYEGRMLWQENITRQARDYITELGRVNKGYTIIISHDLDSINLQGSTTNSLEPGYYYLIITDALSRNYYSDIFAYKADISNCLKLEYSNSYNFYVGNREILLDGAIRSFKPVIYLDAQLGRPEYEFEEEVTSRLGYDYIESQVSKKVYKFNFIAPEYLLDAMRLIRLCDTKACTFNGEVYDMLNFSIEPNWEEQGDLASVEASFEVDNIITNIGGLIS